MVGELPVPRPTRTLMVAWGNWVGLAGAVFLLLLVVVAVFPALPAQGEDDASADAMCFPAPVSVLPPLARIAVGLLRGFARVGLLWMGAAMLLDDGLRSNTLAQLRTFAGVFLAPEAAAWFLLHAFGAQASIEGGMLVLTRGARRLEIAVHDIVRVEPWYLPIPGAGAWLRLTTGERWGYGLALGNPGALARALAAAGGAAVQDPAPPFAAAYGRVRMAVRPGWLHHPLAKFGGLSLVMAVVAFRLHQYIAYGSTFGEYYTFGLRAYLTTFSLWWATWTIGVVLCAAALRAAIEGGTLLVVLLHPAQAIATRHWLERIGLVALYVGLPGWLLLQIFRS